MFQTTNQVVSGYVTRNQSIYMHILPIYALVATFAMMMTMMTMMMMMMMYFWHALKNNPIMYVKQNHRRIQQSHLGSDGLWDKLFLTTAWRETSYPKKYQITVNLQSRPQEHKLKEYWKLILQPPTAGSMLILNGGFKR